MVQKNNQKALIILFIFVSVLVFSHLVSYVSQEATKTLIEAGRERTFEMVFFNFILHYVLCGILSFATFHYISLFKVKYLTRPLQITCVFAILIQIYGAIGYVGMWNEAYYSQCLVMVKDHYNALIALTIIQLMLFVNFWMNNHVAYIDRFRAVSWFLYTHRLLPLVPHKAK